MANRPIHRLLYRLLPLDGYLRVVSRLFFVWQRLGIGRYAPATEYVYHLPQLVRPGDVCIDIGANLGYYTRTIARLTGPRGQVYAVEPVAPVRKVLSRNVRRCGNVDILPFALGTENKPIRMGNDSVSENGYLGTGQHFVNDTGRSADVEFTAEMRRGSELFARLERLDFIKCDIEGYETIVMREMRPLLERFRPAVLIETGGTNRPQIVALFRELGYAGFTLDRGREVPLSETSEKDIVFRPQPAGQA
ncbi:MAG: FkbM family methyltransferase [Alistipes sp.]|nr:FkbM family methyltransferase [Alistipes sp.]MDE6624165.1 FkbM family methyltransferase [Alistipes sp.]